MCSEQFLDEEDYLKKSCVPYTKSCVPYTTTALHGTCKLWMRRQYSFNVGPGTRLILFAILVSPWLLASLFRNVTPFDLLRHRSRIHKWELLFTATIH